MISSKDREKLKVLLSDTITLLCKNGLEFSTDLNVEALIGITLDSQNVVLVSINETVGIDGKDSEEAMVGGSRDGDRTTTSTMVTKPAKRKVDVKEEPEEMEKETSPSAKCSASSTRQPDASAKSTDHRFPRTSSRQKKRKRVDNPNEVVAVDDDENSTEDVVYVKQEAEDGTWNVVSTIPSQGSMSDDNIQFSTGDRFASSALSSSSWQQETSSHTATSLQPHDTPQDTAPSTSATATVGTRYKEEQGDVASHEHSEHAVSKLLSDDIKKKGSDQYSAVDHRTGCETVKQPSNREQIIREVPFLSNSADGDHSYLSTRKTCMAVANVIYQDTTMTQSKDGVLQWTVCGSPTEAKGEEGIYKCEQCPETFTNKGALTSHQMTHEKEINISCPHCGRGSKHKETFAESSHTDTFAHTCGKCGSKFHSRFALMIHLSDCGSVVKKNTCHICGKKFKHKKYMKEHIEATHINPKARECLTCGEMFGHRSSLRRHIKRKHKEQLS